MEFINHLLSFSTAINKIDLNKTSLKKIIWFEEEYDQHDYLDPFCDYFQSGLINAEKKVVRLIIDNFDQAIKSQCGNNLDLSIYADDYYWNYSWETNYDQQNLNKRYVITKLIPNDEKILKELWLRNYITTLSKIIANIRKVTNNPKEVAIHKSGNLKKELPVKSTSLYSEAQSLSFINTGFDESVKPKAKTNKPPKERKELYNNIFKGNAFEVLEKYFSNKNVNGSSATDLRLVFELMKIDNLFIETIELKHYINWLNKYYFDNNLITLRKINLKTKPNIQRTNDYIEYRDATLK
jgi:hypothetical protein|tara:strand:- start:507 stop:1394 length:888 start_codon:yes stop_codon:yes gene_type:complete